MYVCRSEDVHYGRVWASGEIGGYEVMGGGVGSVRCFFVFILRSPRNLWGRGGRYVHYITSTTPHHTNKTISLNHPSTHAR